MNDLTTKSPEGNGSQVVLKPLNKRKRDFLGYWLDFNSDTFSNCYQSAKKAGFSDNYARVLSSASHNIPWVQEGKQYLKQFTPTHITEGFQHFATNARQESNQIRALENLARVQGMYVERQMIEQNVTFTNSVPRPVIEVDSQQG